jgi:alkaline phosphatase
LSEALPAIKAIFGFESLSDYEMAQLQAAYDRSMQQPNQRVNNDDTYVCYGDYEPLTVKCTHLMNREAGLSWTTYSHTGVPVTTSAMGAGQELFNGYYENTDIFEKIRTVMQLPVAPPAVAARAESEVKS